MLKSNQFGTTMMEAIAAISVVTVLTVAAVKLIGNMFEMFRQNMVANEVQEIQKNIATRYRLEGNYAELSSEKMTPQKMREEQLIPSQMLIGGKIVHRLNGEVEIKTSSLGSEYFDITFKDLSLRTCMNLSQLSWNNIQGTDLFQIKINNKVFKLPINGVKFGVLGYTYGTNGIEIPEGKEYLVNLYSKERIKEDIERLEGTCDSILVSMHWGDEYSTTPNAEQQELAQYMADLGVDVIIGEHPHVIQPMDWIEGKDGNLTLVIYSLGNFLSSQDEAFNMLGGCASFDIRKDGNTGETTVENVKWYPVVNHISYGDYMAGTRDYRVYLLKDYTDELASQHRLGITRQYFIDKTEEVMNDKFEIVY